jgi:hypothetical protein
MTSGEVSGYIAAWRPSAAPPPAAAFARQVVAAAGPADRTRAKNLLWAADTLASWAVPLGLELSPRVLLHPSVIERFAAHAPGLSGTTRRTLRTTLRFLGRRVVPDLHPLDAPVPRERATARPATRRSPATSRWLPPSPPERGRCASPRWYAWAPAPG